MKSCFAIALIILGVLGCSKPTETAPKDLLAPLVVTFEDFAGFDPDVEPKYGATIDPKAGTIMFPASKERVIVGFAPKRAISGFLEIDRSLPFNPNTSAKTFFVVMDKDGEVKSSNVSVLVRLR